MLSIKGKKVKACHRGKGDRREQNAMHLTLKEIRRSQDVLSLTFFSFVASNPPSKRQKLIFHWWPIINFASLETASSFLSCFCFCFPDVTVKTGGEKAHPWTMTSLQYPHTEHQGLLSKSLFLLSGVLCVCAWHTLCSYIFCFGNYTCEATTSGDGAEGLAYVGSIYRESNHVTSKRDELLLGGISLDWLWGRRREETQSEKKALMEAQN